MATQLFNKKPKNRKYLKTIKLYVVPIITIIIFIFILLGLTLPKLVGILELNNKISEVNAELDTRRTEVEKLKALYENIDEVSNYLSVVREIAPVGITEVVGFRDKITELVKSNNLQVSSQILSESDIQNEGSESDFFLREIPFLFDVLGDYENIIAFLDDLNSVDEFIVVKQMELGQNGDGVWGMTLNIVKYQFTEELNEENVQLLFQNISVDEKISDEIREYLDRRLQ